MGTKKTVWLAIFKLSSRRYGASITSISLETVSLRFILLLDLVMSATFYWCKTGHPFKNFSLSFLVFN